MAVITSYFANAKNFPKNREKISISRFTPKWFKDCKDYKALAPSAELLKNYKNELVTEEEYEKIYRKETLSKLDPKKVYNDLKNSILLCYEKDSDFCHRQIVCKWLNENGYKAHELEKEVRLAVIGSRDFNDYNILKKVLNNFVSHYQKVTIVSGSARGADSLAERYAKENELSLDIYPAEWDKHGKSAGFIRNQTIWDNSDKGIAFWDGESEDTKHSFDIAKKQNKELFVYNYNTKAWNTI